MTYDPGPVDAIITQLKQQNRVLASLVGETVPPEIGDVPGFAPSSITAAQGPRFYAAAMGSPPKIVEPPPSNYLGSRIPIDRYSLNPGVEYYKQQLPGATFGLPQPFMFGTGDYPVITGSGVDPAVLKWVPWYLRHSAAFSPSATHVLQIIEAGLGGDIDPEQLQTGDGRDQLGAYFGRIAEWVTAPAPGDEMTDEEIDRLFTPPS